MNGCMHLLAGGHKAGARIHFKRRDWQICDTDVPATGRVAVPMTVGDVLLFDGKIPHGTPVNRTEDFRWAVQYHYRPATAVQLLHHVQGHDPSTPRTSALHPGRQLNVLPPPD